MSLPAADRKGRKIIVPHPNSHDTTELVTLFHKAHGLVEARFSTQRMYAHPDEAPSWARLTFFKGQWRGDVLFQEFAATELDALRAMQGTLLELGFDELPKLSSAVALMQTPEHVVVSVAASGLTKQSEANKRTNNIGKWNAERKAALAQQGNGGGHG